MVIKLDLKNTYGQQTEDIAKKNKYNNIQMSINVVSDIENVGEDFVQTEEIITTPDNNLSYRASALSNSSHLYSGPLSVYIGEIEYKTYTFNLDLKSEQYKPLVSAKTQLPYTFLFDGEYYKEIDDSGDKFYIGDITKTNLHRGMHQNNSNTTYNFTNNIYITVKDEEGKTEEIENNVINQFNDLVQSGFEISDNSNLYGDFISLIDYFNPKLKEWTNKGDILTISIQIPYKFIIYIPKNVNRSVTIVPFATSYNYKNYEYHECIVSSCSLVIYNDLNVEQEDRSYFDGDRPYSANSSFMFTKGTIRSITHPVEIPTDETYIYTFANEVYEAYKNGKLILNLKYPIGELYDTLNNKLVYIDGVGVARKVDGNYFDENGNIVDMTNEPKITENVPLTEDLRCIVTEGGSPMYFNQDGSVKNFIIQNSNFVYTGLLANEIKLIETSTELTDFVMVYSQPEGVTLTVKRGNQTLQSGAEVEKGDHLRIYATFDKGYRIDGGLYINGEIVNYSGGGYWDWYVTGDVVITINVEYMGNQFIYLDKDVEGLSINAYRIDSTYGGEVRDDRDHYYTLSNGEELYVGDLLNIDAEFIYPDNYEGYRSVLTVNGKDFTGTQYVNKIPPTESETKLAKIFSYRVNKGENVNVSGRIEYMGKSFTISENVMPYITVKRTSSIYITQNVDRQLNTDDMVCIGDKLTITLDSAISPSSLILSGLQQSGSSYIVTGDVSIDINISQLERKIYSSMIVMYSNLANISFVERISSNFDVPLGMLNSTTDTTQTDSAGHYKYYYTAYAGDILEITFNAATGYGITNIWAGPLNGNKTLIATSTTDNKTYTLQYTVSNTVEFKVDAKNMGKTISISNTNTNGFTLSVYRDSSEYAYSGSISNGSIVYPKDVLKISWSGGAGSSRLQTTGLDFVRNSFDGTYYTVQKNATTISITLSN